MLQVYDPNYRIIDVSGGISVSTYNSNTTLTYTSKSSYSSTVYSLDMRNISTVVYNSIVSARTYLNNNANLDIYTIYGFSSLV